MVPLQSTSPQMTPGPGVAVTDGTGVAVGAGVAVGTGVEVGVGPVKSDSYAPASQALPRGRLRRAWSSVGGGQPTVTASMAALLEPRAMVWVGPPLSVRGRRTGSEPGRSPIETKPQVVLSSTL